MSDPYVAEKRGVRKMAVPEEGEPEQEFVSKDRAAALANLAKLNRAIQAQSLKDAEEGSGEEVDKTSFESEGAALLGKSIGDFGRRAAKPLQVPVGLVDEVVVDDSEDEETFPIKYETRYSGTAYDNKRVREAIDKLSTPLDMTDLIFVGRVKQHRPIIKGKFEVEFQSLLASEGIWVSDQASLRYPDDLFAQRMWTGNARMVCGIVSLNNKGFAPITKDNRIDVALFNAKREKLFGSTAESLTAILLHNWSWFSESVDALLDDDFAILKNG